MTIKTIQGEIRFGAFLLLLSVCLIVLLGWGCSSPAKRKVTTAPHVPITVRDDQAQAGPNLTVKNASIPNGPTIEIKKNAPSDTVRVFYERLRENRFREALLLTNLRPAVEGLTDSEISDLGVDFGQIAGQVPAKMPINGEIVSGNDATVTVNMPNEKSGKTETQELQLKKQNGYWVLLIADPVGEKRVRREGKKYFFSLRMDVHHEEAKAMLNRIAKAQAIYSAQHDGKFGELEALVKKGFVPSDALTVESTGYNYSVARSFDGRTYTAFATPAEYGRSGKLSFALVIRRGVEPELITKDNKGRSLNG